ncbi:DUF2905 family protein [Comamonas sp. BIGb0124]|uniref:DUF2905 domain-containing protein n=1 Tax=Comamonas sp. BIGb0124 TaxID=2485130 RepID=UPI000F468CAB|nr:DUF2905 domain-containing protein [Comamonas sp. BIGb0124]ROR22656.1 DUF2905 family protein [Comamonas sp. BIGb0124]
MIRWFLATFLALILINGLWPMLSRLGLGRLPGDLRFRLFGRDVNLPIASTLVLSGLMSLVARLL